jgi:hypothetical protein
VVLLVDGFVVVVDDEDVLGVVVVALVVVELVVDVPGCLELVAEL